jgi:uncharacterized protein (TIGR03089 family)
LSVLERLVDISAETRFGNVADLFRAAVRRDPTMPLLTWYDDATGDRTELSGATLDNWVAKTANLLVDGAGLGGGDAVAVLLPPHWQTAAVLIGSWSAGLSVGSSGTAGPAEVGFVAADRLDQAPDANDLFVLGLAPMATPLREVPAGFMDFVAEVRGHGDHFRPYAPIRGVDAALADGTHHDELCRIAGDRAEHGGFGPTDRVLVDAARSDNPLDWLLTPLAAGASIVLCANLDPALLPARRESERVTRVLD